MKSIMDLHTHTVASGHGYSTLKENIQEAQKKGLKFLGFSEHGPAAPGGPHIFFFRNFRCIPRQYGELRLLCGVEANIMDYEGTLDLEEADLKRMDYVIASMHISCVKPGSREENTQAAIKAMRNPYVKILGHPDDTRYPLDYEAVVRAARKEGVALEINNSSLHPDAVRVGARENITELLKFCKEYQVPVLMGTDSHIADTIGDFDRAENLLKEVAFPEELILNYCPENINKLINITL